MIPLWGMDELTRDPALTMARQSLYRFASLTLVDPRTGSFQALANLRSSRLINDAAELVRREQAAVAEPLGRGERTLDDLRPEKVIDQLPGSAEGLNAEYERVFGLLVSSDCPPYETEYINSKFTFQRSNGLADIAGFYRAFGLELSASHPERQDHIAWELEFMAYLAGLKRAALETGDSEERVEVCCEAERRFLAEHLLWWTPVFARLLELRAGNGFYVTVARLLAAWIAADRALYHLPLHKEPVAPSDIERPEACEGCALQSLA